MTQVKEWSNPELNRKLAELMGYMVTQGVSVLWGKCYELKRDGVFQSRELNEDCAWDRVPDYCTDPAASLGVEKAAIAADNAGYVRNLSIIKWSDAVDPEEVAEWTDIDIQGVGDLFTATPRERAEAAYMVLSQQ